jgi:hypothetical protein
MRNLLLGASALIAIAVAGSASAQNISVQSNQTNNATVTANTELRNIEVGTRPTTTTFVGGNLTGTALAVGNLIQTSAPIGQGFSEAASNNGGVLSPQNNSGTITANVGFGSGVTAGVTNVAATAIANNALLSGVQVQNAGSRVDGQFNNGAVTANTTLTGGGYNVGNLTAGSLAIGNNFVATGSGAVYLGAGAGTNGGALTQTNQAAISANTVFVNGGNSGALVANANAIGNAFSPSAPVVSVAVTQNNSGPQNAYLDVKQGSQSLNASGSAVGNLIAPTGGSFNGVNLVQSNSAGQTSTVTVGNTLAVFNGGNTNVNSLAVGNAIQISQTGAVGLATGSQTNTGPQSASVSVPGGASFTGGSAFASQAFGNLIAVNTGSTFGSGIPQNNAATVTASTRIDTGAFGPSTTASSFAAGNILQVQAGGSVEGINGSANQLNTGAINSLTSVTGGLFAGNLAASSQSIGNVTSVTIGR